MKSIRSYAFAILFAVGVTPLLVLALVLNANFRRSALSDADDHLTLVTSETGERVEELLREIHRDLERLRVHPAVRSPESLGASLRTELERMLRICDSVSELAFYGGDGKLIVSAQREQEDPAPLQETSSWFAAALRTNAPVVSPPANRKGLEGVFVSYYFPVLGETGADGVVRVCVSIERVSNMLAQIDVGKAGHLMLIDEDGMIIHQGKFGVTLKQFPDLALWNQWKKTLAGRCEIGGNGWMYVGHQIRAGKVPAGANWYLIGLLPEMAVLSGLDRSRDSAGMVLLGTLGLVLGGAFLLSRQVCYALSPLVRAAGHVAEHHWDRVRIPLQGPQEICEVGRSFNQMAEAIRMYQDDLESQVAVRTKELKQKRVQLSKANAQLGAALDSSLDGILVVGTRGEILTMNRRLREFFGISVDCTWNAEELERDLRLKMESTSAFTGFEVDLNPEQSSLIDGRRETEWMISQPRERSLRVYSSPVEGPPGKEFGRLWMFQDITETRTLERGLRESQKLEAIGRLAGGIAHDFNNLLAGMMGNMCLLEGKVTRSKEARDALQAAQGAARRASELVRQILGAARRSFLNLSSCEATEIVEEVVSLVRRGFDPKIQISVVRPDSPCRIHVDPSQLHQVLMNLAVNARDAMVEGVGGALKFSLQHVELSESEAESVHPRLARAGRFIRIDVSDTGTGIPEGVVDRIFEPFFTTKPTGQGTGLGLATSAGIVEQHKGWLTCETQMGRGTIFRIYLPEDEAAPEAAKVIPLTPSMTLRRGDGATILLVDDEDLVRNINERLLKALGYQILTAVDGVEGLARYQEHRSEISLVLLDLTMPRMSGAETFRQLREWNPDLPVIIYSGYVVDPKEFALANGSMPSAILTKPLMIQALAGKIGQILDEKSASSGLSAAA